MTQTMSVIPTALDALPRLFHRANFKGDKVRLPHYYVRGLGPSIEGVGEELVNYLRRQPDAQQLEIGTAGEGTNTPGRSRPLRVIDVVKPGHRAACDVNLTARGHDLYVRFEALPRTRIAILRKVIYAGLFAVLWAAAMVLFANTTNQLDAMARDYAKRDATTGNEMIRYRQIRYGEYTDSGRPWSYLDYFHNDPVGFLTAVGRVPVLGAMLIGGVLLLIPADWIRYPCRWLGYPLPSAFRNDVNSHNARVAVALSDVLEARGIYKDQMVSVEQL